jgi:hypothetical protein
MALACPQPGHLSDAGLVFNDEPAQSSGRGAEDAGAEPGGDPASTRAQMEALQREMVASMQMMVEGMEQVSRGTEASMDELENVLNVMRSQLQTEGQPQRPPPASKKLMTTLPRYVLTKEKLAEMGSDRTCPVCTDDLTVGAEVIVLPCKHVYHPQCVQPWFKGHNSCPTCRKELPTDDPVYEAKKEREQEEEEERRGAANAVSHNEFMYI